MTGYIVQGYIIKPPVYGVDDQTSVALTHWQREELYVAGKWAIEEDNIEEENDDMGVLIDDKDNKEEEVDSTVVERCV